MATGSGSQQYRGDGLAYLPCAQSPQGENSGKPAGSKAVLGCRGLGFQDNQGIAPTGGDNGGWSLFGDQRQESISYWPRIYAYVIDQHWNSRYG